MNGDEEDEETEEEETEEEDDGKLGLDARKPVFGVYDKVRFRPACSATETS